LLKNSKKYNKEIQEIITILLRDYYNYKFVDPITSVNSNANNNVNTRVSNDSASDSDISKNNTTVININNSTNTSVTYFPRV
jgi:hypothetical protein